jgi:phage-related holin
MLKFLMQLYGSFKVHFVGLSKVYLNAKLFALGAAITLAYEAIKAQFLKDHSISWDITVNIFDLVLIDTALGLWKHIKLNSFSSEGWGRFATKIIIYWLFIKVVDKVNVISYIDWTGDLLLSGLLVREAISIIENMGVIYPNIIPKWILKRLQAFDENGVKV